MNKPVLPVSSLSLKLPRRQPIDRDLSPGGVACVSREDFRAR